MNKDNVLKKEFKKSDVERIRNLVKKDYSGSTKSQSGYKKSFKKYLIMFGRNNENVFYST